MEIQLLNGKKMTTREEMHDYLSNKLRLPSFYGKNLDALNDCLSSFGKDCVIVLYNADIVLNACGDYGKKMIDVFRNAADYHGFQFFIEK